MANKRAKLSDIAREAGVSLTAASFYINGKAKQYKLSPATCERLEAAVRKYDYVPNLFARAMQQNRTFLIGLLVRDRINSSFWSDIIAGIENGDALFFMCDTRAKPMNSAEKSGRSLRKNSI